MDQKNVQQAVTNMRVQLSQVKHAENKAEFIQNAVHEMLQGMGINPQETAAAVPKANQSGNSTTTNTAQVNEVTQAIQERIATVRNSGNKGQAIQEAILETINNLNIPIPPTVNLAAMIGAATQAIGSSTGSSRSRKRRRH
ncbi:hypothetical protein GJ688_15625 [Heliobacillus mobilis]|uniref:Uncharacterized protein n=1 Tax=Heliobacterium mobile TaxID=28064 RepID=A0A6I3SN10_HELMO|nr:hypothetical protein [Heliobacterium mobile]MTV50394.1 hypothetical protein [Heliobacterium mobile]